MDRQATDNGGFAGGVFLRGTIIGRARKIMENGCRYMYTVDTGSGVVKLAVWGDHDFMEPGLRMDAAVEIRPYLNGKGRPMYQLALPNLGLTEGEEEFRVDLRLRLRRTRS